MRQNVVSVGETIEVLTGELVYGGEAIARYQGLIIFVQGAAPNERVRVRILETKKSFARAIVEKVVHPSTDRRQPLCQYFGECGGCQLQHIAYPAQLTAKIRFVRDSLRRIGKIDWQNPIPIISANEYGYRARARLKIDGEAENLAIGFHKAASHVVCDIESCPILHPELNRALHTLRSLWHESRYDGSKAKSEIELAFSEAGVAIDPPLTEFGSSTEQHASEFSNEAICHLDGITYQYHPATFFQGNSELLEAFVKTAIQGETGALALDLYAGIGLFTLPLAQYFDRVIGVEADYRAVAFANLNRIKNHLQNVSFQQNRVDQWLKARYEERRNIDLDLILLDPPRTGAADAIPYIARLHPKRITYVSCDPTTMARDLRTLIRHGYNLNRVIAFDFFPQTYHVETIVSLEKGG